VKSVITLLCCFFAGSLWASTPLDSLEAKKARIEANWRIAPAETYEVARSLFFESKEVPEIQAWAGNIAGILSAGLGMLDSSDWYYQNALAVAKEHKVRETLQKIKMNQGINCNYRGDFKGAAFAFYDAIREARVDTNLMLEAYASSNLGFALQRIDLPLQALRYHLKAARLFWTLDQWILPK
jgi:tetratricopeptide (TPR) repeat protein